MSVVVVHKVVVCFMFFIGVKRISSLRFIVVVHVVVFIIVVVLTEFVLLHIVFVTVLHVRLRCQNDYRSYIHCRHSCYFGCCLHL